MASRPPVPLHGYSRMSLSVCSAQRSPLMTSSITAANSGPRWLIMGRLAERTTRAGSGVGPGTRSCGSPMRRSLPKAALGTAPTAPRWCLPLATCGAGALLAPAADCIQLRHGAFRDRSEAAHRRFGGEGNAPAVGHGARDRARSSRGALRRNHGRARRGEPRTSACRRRPRPRGPHRSHHLRSGGRAGCVPAAAQCHRLAVPRHRRHLRTAGPVRPVRALRVCDASRSARGGLGALAGQLGDRVRVPLWRAGARCSCSFRTATCRRGGGGRSW